MQSGRSTPPFIYIGYIEPANPCGLTLWCIELFLRPENVGHIYFAQKERSYLLGSDKHNQSTLFGLDSDDFVVVRKDNYDGIVADVIDGSSRGTLGAGSTSQARAYKGTWKTRLVKGARALVFEQDAEQRIALCSFDQGESSSLHHVDMLKRTAHLRKVRYSFFKENESSLGSSCILSIPRIKGCELQELIDVDTLVQRDGRIRLGRGDLQYKLKNCKPLLPFYLSVDDLFTIALQFLIQLGQLHDRGIIHRDLKLDNVLVSRDGVRWQVNIIDFNLARKAEINDGKRCGNMFFYPEEAHGANGKVLVDEKTDLYAAAIMLAMLFRETEWTNRMELSDEEFLDFQKEHLWQVKFDKLFGDKKPDGLTDGLLDRIKAVLEKMTSRERDERPALQACIATLERIYLDYQLIKVDASQHDSLKKAVDSAIGLRATLGQYARELTIACESGETLTRRITEKTDTIRVFAQKVCDSGKLEMEYFIRTLNVKCLLSVNSMDSLNKELNAIVENFVAQYDEIANMETHVEYLKDELARYSDDISLDQLAALYDMLNQLTRFRKKILDTPLDLDAICDQTYKMTNKVLKVYRATQYFELMLSRLASKDAATLRVSAGKGR